MNGVLQAQDFGLEPMLKLTKEIKQAAAKLGPREARFLVDTYYMLQKNRIRSGNQIRALTESGEPSMAFNWLASNSEVMEENIKKLLGAYSQANRVGRWAESITGIGPVISAGLLAHIDLQPWRCAMSKLDLSEKSCNPREPHGPACMFETIHTVGHIWRFAGLDPTLVWKEKQKRPWNASLKTLCWKIGESFVKVSSNPKDYYGKIWLQRKRAEEAKNEQGFYKELCEKELTIKNYGKGTEAYAAYITGKLPKGRIHARAKRYAVKLFLSHWHWVAYEDKFGQEPPKPYVIEHLGHTDLLKPPLWPCE